MARRLSRPLTDCLRRAKTPGRGVRPGVGVFFRKTLVLPTLGSYGGVMRSGEQPQTLPEGTADMIPTTTIGTWCNYGDRWNTSVEATIADFLNGGDADWREAMEESGATDRIAEDYRDAVEAVLPVGISICGNEFIADADVDFDADEIREAIEAIDLSAIVKRHDVDRDDTPQSSNA